MSAQAAFTLFLLVTLVICIAACIPDKPLVPKSRKELLADPDSSCNRSFVP